MGLVIYISSYKRKAYVYLTDPYRGLQRVVVGAAHINL